METDAKRSSENRFSLLKLIYGKLVQKNTEANIAHLRVSQVIMKHKTPSNDGIMVKYAFLKAAES